MNNNINTDIDNRNQELAKVNVLWYKNICKKWMENPYKKGIEKKYTEPFCTALLDNNNTNKMIMFVGQETNGYGSIEGFENNLEKRIRDSQQWIKEHLEYNFKIEKPIKPEYYTISKKQKTYETSKFFKAMRFLYNSGFNICWNNIDKIQYKKGVKLSIKDEEILNGNVIQDNMTILQKEIDIIKPNIIIFAIGPRYKESLEYALGLRFNEKPNKDKEYITNTIKGIPFIWTYHPLYRFNKDEILTIIKTNLSKTIYE